MAILRSVAGMKNVPDVDKTSDAAVHETLDTHHVRSVIMRHRLIYFIRAIKYAPPSLCRLIMLGFGFEGSWLAQVQADCDFIWNSIDIVHVDLPNRREHFIE